MKQLSSILYWALALTVFAWCGLALHGDVAHLSFAPVLRSWDLVLLASALSLLNYVFRIVRWQRYLARLGHALPFGFTALTYISGFAFTLSPGKVGEMVRARYYSQRAIPLADIAGAFCVERLLDLMAMLVLATFILAAVPRYQGAMWSAGVLILVALGLLASLPWASIADFVVASRQIPRPLARLIAATARALGAAKSLLRPGVLVLGLLLGLTAWGLEGVGFYVLSSMAAPVHVAPAAMLASAPALGSASTLGSATALGPAVGVGIYAVAILVGALSFLPGGLGSTEAVMTALLATQGYAVADALLITLVCRLVTLWLAVCIGWGAIFILRQRPTVAAVTPWP